MQRFWFVFCAGLAAIHYSDARYKREIHEDGYRAPPPAILTHKQDVTNDGVFNYVFAADNGLKQGESISPDGTRTGAYQYIDPNGKTISVKYMAGKDGFRILEGDHIPSQPKPVEPIPEYQPPEYREKLEKKNMKFKVPVKDYNERERNDYKEKKIEWRQPQPAKYQEQRYQQPKVQNYHANEEQRGYQQNSQPQKSRFMLYDVEQRHDSNYRRYLDNGQAADGNDNNQPQRAHFDGGYNFEIKG